MARVDQSVDVDVTNGLLHFEDGTCAPIIKYVRRGEEDCAPGLATHVAAGPLPDGSFVVVEVADEAKFVPLN